MGHYDSSRDGYCGKCGAAPGNMTKDGQCPLCHPPKHLITTTDTPPLRGCRLPPPGWYCSRPAGHSGPCAARALAKTAEAPHTIIGRIEEMRARVHTHTPTRLYLGTFDKWQLEVVIKVNIPDAGFLYDGLHAYIVKAERHLFVA